MHTLPITLEDFLFILYNVIFVLHKNYKNIKDVGEIWVKLTQGTGRGTCLWNKKMSIEYFNSCFWEDFLIVLFSYSLFKYIIFSLIIELIWPTNYFNKKHNFQCNIKYRSFSEFLLKLRLYSNFFNLKLIFITIKLK